MSKIRLINNYLEKIDVVLEKINEVEAEKLVEILYSIYSEEIKGISKGLNKYFHGIGSYINDLEILKEHLINYKANIEIEENKRREELRILELKLELQKSNSSIYNINKNENNSSSSSNTSVNITMDNAIDSINKLSEDVLSQDEKSELEDMIASISAANSSNNKTKIIDRMGKVLKYITDKGVQVGIAVLPYLGEISKMLAE